MIPADNVLIQLLRSGLSRLRSFRLAKLPRGPEMIAARMCKPPQQARQDSIYDSNLRCDRRVPEGRKVLQMSTSSSPAGSPTYERSPEQPASPQAAAASSYPQTASIVPISLDTLLPHLLASKRSLASITHVHRASALCASTRAALESSAITTARTSFLRSGIASQLNVLQHVCRNSERTARQGKTDFEAVVQDLDEADGRLRGTLDRLRETMVEAKLRPEGEERRSLLSFVDETSVEDAVAGTRAVTDEAGEEVRRFEKGCTEFEGGVARVRDLLFKSSRNKGGNSGEIESGDVGVGRSPLPEILQEMDDHAREMAVNLESLVSHFDLCVTAIKHVEGGSDAAMKVAGGDLPDGVDITQETKPLSEEDKARMMEVLEEDAGQVEDVVMEIKHHIVAMEELNERVETHTAGLAREHTDTTGAFRLLEETGQRLPGYITQSQIFLIRWEEEKAKIDERLEELEGLREFYDGFVQAYDNLLIEIGRRKALEMRMGREVETAMKRIEKLYDDDLEEREAFKKEQGDFLPVDIWPGLMSAPLRYRVLADEEREKVPDISKSVIHGAIKRVHGSQ